MTSVSVTFSALNRSLKNRLEMPQASNNMLRRVCPKIPSLITYLYFTFNSAGRAVDILFYLLKAEVISYRGYPIEVHTVTTEDGYI